MLVLTIRAIPTQAQERKQAAIRVLSNYSQFVMACIGEGVAPHQLRLHLMKVPICLLLATVSYLRMWLLHSRRVHYLNNVPFFFHANVLDGYYLVILLLLQLVVQPAERISIFQREERSVIIFLVELRILTTICVRRFLTGYGFILSGLHNSSK